RIGAQRSAREIIEQIALTRRAVPSGQAPGHLHWSMKALMRNQGGVADQLRTGLYSEASSPPPR
ncbi:MAG: hypothetical protein M3463_20570, partial [Verrucomicrobiota bacterium]|nr:hypothetical protein [Verrucomicrobiota bacterium]